MEERKHVAVGAEIAGNAPGENKADGERGHDGVDANRASKKKVRIHKESEERGDADEKPGDEREADEYLAECYEIRPDLRVWLYKILKEPRVPPLHIRVCALCFRKRSLDEPYHRLSDIVAYPCGVVEFAPTCREPRPAEVDTHDEPQWSYPRVGKKKM